MPKVSVIIPTYNRAYVLKNAIDSIQAQTFQDFEILVVDDGSSDDTRSLVASIHDEKIKYLYKENGGVSSARNLGMLHSRGDYVGFLDSDDTWPVSFLSLLVEALDKNPEYGVAYSATTLTYPDGKKIESYLIDRCVSGQITTELFQNSFVSPMAVLIRSNVLKGFWFDEKLKICDDNDAFMRLSVYTRFLFVPGVEVMRTWSDDNHSIAVYIEGSYIRGLSLERFYYHLGGDKFVSKSVARRKMGHVYRRAGERHRKKGYRKAALTLLMRALRYNPSDVRLYAGLLKALLLRKCDDHKPGWEMPEALGPPLCTVHKNSSVH